MSSIDAKTSIGTAVNAEPVDSPAESHTRRQSTQTAPASGGPLSGLSAATFPVATEITRRIALFAGAPATFALTRSSRTLFGQLSPVLRDFVHDRLDDAKNVDELRRAVARIEDLPDEFEAKAGQKPERPKFLALERVKQRSTIRAPTLHRAQAWFAVINKLEENAGVAKAVEAGTEKYKAVTGLPVITAADHQEMQRAAEELESDRRSPAAEPVTENIAWEYSAAIMEVESAMLRGSTPDQAVEAGMQAFVERTGHLMTRRADIAGLRVQVDEPRPAPADIPNADPDIQEAADFLTGWLDNFS